MKSTNRNKRILKEIENAAKSNMFEFYDDVDGTYGEKNACYIRFWVNEGAFARQTHILEVRFVWGSNEVYEYPKKPLMIRFVTPLFHTNISATGSICLDVIKEEKWSPMYGLETVYNSIIALLEDPNHNSPFNSTASSACKKHSPEEYQKMTMDYYIKNMPTEAYRRAIALLQSDRFVTGVDTTEQRATYVQMLLTTLGIETPKKKEEIPSEESDSSDE